MAYTIEDLFSIHSEDHKIVESLYAAIQANANASTGFDYIKFKQSVKTMIDTMGMNEETATKSAYTTASTLGITKQKLIDNVQTYSNVLAKEKSKFDLALKNNNLKIAQKEKEPAQLTEKIKQLKAQIADLEKQINDMELRIQNASHDIEGDKAKSAETARQFEDAYHSLNDRIKTDVDTFNKYL